MTRKELSQFYYLNKLRVEAEQELDRLIQERVPKPQPISDMPHGKGEVGTPTENLAIQITEQIETVRAIVVNCQKKEKEIWLFVEQLEKDDSFLAVIVKYRCINRLSWQQVAIKTGSTEESCRKYYERKIPKE